MASRKPVPTPAWRKVTSDQLRARLEQQGEPSNSSTSDDEDETFINKHNVIAEEERSRWCYTSTKGGTSKLESKRSRSSAPRQEAIYPKPLESFAIMEEAKKAYLEACASGSGKNAELKRNLAHFLEPIQSIAAIESVIRKEKEHIMKRFLSSRTVPNGASSQTTAFSDPNGSQSMVSRFTFEDGTSIELPENPSKRRKRNDASVNFLHSSSQEIPEALRRRKPEKKSLDVALIELTLERITTIESEFNRKTISLYNAWEDILRQSDSRVPNQKTFAKMERSYDEACRSAGGDASGASRGKDRLVEIIKSKIDPERFPVVADAFNLSAGYKLEGCSSEKTLQAQALNGLGSKKISRSTDSNDDDGDDGVTQENSALSAFGFSMPDYALDSDEEMEVEVGNPLTDDVWGDVRERILRHRRRKGEPSKDDLLAGVEMPDVQVIWNPPVPKSLVDGTKSDLLHPDDREINENILAPSPLPNGGDSGGCAEIIYGDDDDSLLSELDMTPPDTPQNDPPGTAPNRVSTQLVGNGVGENACVANHDGTEIAEVENFDATVSASRDARKSASGRVDDRDGDGEIGLGGITNGIG